MLFVDCTCVTVNQLDCRKTPTDETNVMKNVSTRNVIWNETVYTPGIVTWIMLRSSTPAAVFTTVFVVELAVLAILDELFFPESKRFKKQL